RWSISRHTSAGRAKSARSVSGRGVWSESSLTLTSTVEVGSRIGSPFRTEILLIWPWFTHWPTRIKNWRAGERSEKRGVNGMADLPFARSSVRGSPQRLDACRVASLRLNEFLLEEVS